MIRCGVLSCKGLELYRRASDSSIWGLIWMIEYIHHGSKDPRVLGDFDQKETYLYDIGNLACCLLWGRKFVGGKSIGYKLTPLQTC